MKPTGFRQTTHVFGKPADMTDEECDQLPVYMDEKQVVSCWKMTDEELAEVVRTKKIWVFQAGNYVQPISLQVENPFESNNSINQ